MRLCFRVGQQAAREVEAETDTVKLGRELSRVESLTKVSLGNGFLAHPADTIEPDFLVANEKLAQFTGPVSELNRSGY